MFKHLKKGICEMKLLQLFLNSKKTRKVIVFNPSLHTAKKTFSFFRLVYLGYNLCHPSPESILLSKIECYTRISFYCKYTKHSNFKILFFSKISLSLTNHFSLGRHNNFLLSSFFMYISLMFFQSTNNSKL